VSELPRGALLVGSVPLRNADEVFRVAAEHLGDRLARIPDGETGDRAGWVAWQGRNFKLPELELVKPQPGQYPPTPRFRPRSADVDLATLRFPSLGFADAAIDSYPAFAALKADGAISPGVRFQVSIPTPIAPVAMFIVDEHQAAVEPVYEQTMRADVDRLLAAIPNDELAIQWDICIEVWMWERWLPAPFDDVEAALVERVARVGGWIPDDVQLGHHYCYGDFQHEHFHQPRDAGVLVDMANRMVAVTPRTVDWVHLPVPVDRDDDAYFAPLEDLRLPVDTELYLGLIHIRDGADGARRRIAAAQRHTGAFGVACECGMGRRPPGRGGDDDGLCRLLDLHAQVSAPAN